MIERIQSAAPVRLNKKIKIKYSFANFVSKQKFWNINYYLLYIAN